MFLVLNLGGDGNKGSRKILKAFYIMIGIMFVRTELGYLRQGLVLN